MPRSYTYCLDCDNVVEASRKRTPRNWLCSKFPRVEGGGFVAPDAWVAEEPFMRCVHINGGDCPLFVTRSEPDGSDRNKEPKNG